MRRAHRPTRPPVALALVLALLVVGALLGGCKAASSGTSGSSKSASTSTAEKAAAPVFPPPPMMRTPQTSVYSYLLWISAAYRVLDSDIATPAFSANQEVRVNSYVEYNRQKSQAIEQTLTAFAVRSVTTKGSVATVAVNESWAYRYIDTATDTYKTPAMTASYATTYTVVKGATGWLVDSVEATSVAGTVK